MVQCYKYEMKYVLYVIDLKISLLSFVLEYFCKLYIEHRSAFDFNSMRKIICGILKKSFLSFSESTKVK